MVSFIIINYQNFIQIFDLDVNQILSLLYIIFSIFSKETARNSILSNQPNISIRLLSWCIVTKQGVERKASFTIVTQASAHEPFPRGQGTDVADSSPRNPPSPSTAKLFVVKADFSRTKWRGGEEKWKEIWKEEEEEEEEGKEKKEKRERDANFCRPPFRLG